MTRVGNCMVALALIALPSAASALPEFSLTLMKTVGTDPTMCAPTNLLPDVPPDRQVYYCYKMTNTGVVTSTLQQLEDDQCGVIIDDSGSLSYQQCCPNAGSSASACSGIACKVAGDCPGSDPVCKQFSYTGFCCDSTNGVNCAIPSVYCSTNTDCNNISGFNVCADASLEVPPGGMVTRVITKVVPPRGVTNHAKWSASVGLCCDPMTGACSIGSFTQVCATDADCGVGDLDICVFGNGFCCASGNPNNCDDPARLCRSDDDCDDASFPDCIGDETPMDMASATARVGPPVPAGAPALSPFGLAGAVLLLGALGVFKLTRRRA